MRVSLQVGLSFLALAVAPGATPAAAGALLGKVVLAPLCPGPAAIGRQCPAKAISTTIDIFRSSDAHDPYRRTKSDGHGEFRIVLEPGTYVLRPASAAIYPQAPAQTVTVVRDKFTPVRIIYDSGIR